MVNSSFAMPTAAYVPVKNAPPVSRELLNVFAAAQSSVASPIVTRPANRAALSPEVASLHLKNGNSMVGTSAFRPRAGQAAWANAFQAVTEIDDQAGEREGTQYSGEQDGLLAELCSKKNLELLPQGRRDGDFRLPAWEGRQIKVSRFHFRKLSDKVLRKLKSAPAHAYLLQGVPAAEAQTVVDRLGMNGFFSRTNAVRGILILVHPMAKVADQRRVVLTGKIKNEKEARRALNRAARLGEKARIRAAQFVKLEIPGGQVTLWNTQLSTGNETELGERRARQLARLQASMKRFGNCPSVGGGQLGASFDSQVAGQIGLLKPGVFNIDKGWIVGEMVRVDAVIGTKKGAPMRATAVL